MNISDELETVVDWADYYHRPFHLPTQERGGYVMLPITNKLSIVHMPPSLADRVLGSLRRHSDPGPVLARQNRCSFIAGVDYSPGYQILDLLARNNICVPALGSAVMMPTSLGRWTREGTYWMNPPHRDELLPLLSTVVTTALAAAASRR